ncbi:uncharacterized protein [Venturia canescens]|uniref:uncharacterized protein n=1 Tax=Venturia canescens TaxID=32260 RepID=UPI001C9CF4E2|nr:uncharacterized protein LOC122418384 [Venturia canescens]
MVHRVSLEGAVNFTRLSVRLACTWPPSGSAMKWELVREDCAWCISLLSVFCLLIPLINSIHENISNPVIITQTMCFCSACVIIIMKSLVVRYHRKKIQILIDEMMEFVETCRQHERQVLQDYVDKCWVYHVIISFLNYTASVSMIISPFVIADQKMPTAAVYPFSIESGIPMYLAFIHQSIVGLQTSASLTVDCQMAIMMWFAGARLEILAGEIQNSTSIKDFSYFVKKHERLLFYATEVADAMRYVAFTTTCVCGIASIVCCMQLVGNQPILVKLQFGPVSIVGLTNLMICVWPNEDIVRVCDLIGKSVYDTPWVEMSPKTSRDIVMILQRSQQPVQVSVAGFIPALSFEFYTSFLSCVLSCFTTLRLVMLGTDDESILIDEMEEFLKNAQPHEKQILRNNVNRFCMFHCAISFMNYLSSITISMSPFILPNQRMPTFATYPFSIDSGLPMYLIYVHQSIVGLQCSAGLTVDCQVALMMWFAGARLEILAEEIKKFKNIKNYSSIVKKHEKLLSYVVRVSGTMCYVAFTTSCVCGIALIMFCLQLVGNQPWSVKLQFGPGILVCFINLMVCTWPTENMMGMLLIDEMEDFLNNCNDKEKRVLQSYVDKCWIFYGSITIVNYLGAVPVIFGPFVFPHQRFPTFAVYPFPVESGLTMYLVFLHQCFTGLQVSAAFTIDCQMALLMWFAGARLEILAKQAADVNDPEKFRSFVEKHQRHLTYIDQVAGTMCYIALATTFICSLASVMFSLQLIGNQPLTIRMQYGPATVVALVNLLICAWPTENVIRVSLKNHRRRMESKASLGKAVKFTRLSVRLVCTWPPSKHATKWGIFREDFSWCISFLNVFCLLVPLLFSIYEYRADPIIMTQSTGLAGACGMIIIKSLILRVHRKKCQLLIHEMEEFVKTCEDHELHVLQSYIDRCWIFYTGVTVMNYLASVPVIFGPFVFPHQRMPTFAVYPFSIDSGISMYLIFVHQSIVGFQTSAGLTIDCQVALLMWFAGARLEILAEEIKKSSGIEEFGSFVDKHQRLLIYASQVSETMCYIALTSACVCGFSTIMGTMQLLGDRPFIIKAQYGPATLVSLINLLVCAWPTENMLRVCDLIGTNIYNISWLDISPKLMKDITMILRRSQKPVLVSVGGFLPALSFRFYASFLSSVFSYFTTFRLLVLSDAEAESVNK